VSLPSTKLRAGSWLVVATIKLPTVMLATYRSLYLQIIEASRDDVALVLNDQCTPIDIALVNPNRGMAYVGIVKDYVSTTSPNSSIFVGSVADLIIAPALGVVQRDTSVNDLLIDDAGSYSFVLANNCSAIDLKIMVNGGIRLTYA
jgi:hypothetical protein